MVKRYLIGVYGEHQHPSGDFVHWQDYQSICSELEQVKRERTINDPSEIHAANIRADAAERRAENAERERVVSGRQVDAARTKLAEIRNLTVTRNVMLQVLQAAFAEPAGEAKPVGQQVGWAYRDKKWDNDRWHVCGWEKPRECEGREVQPIFVGSTPPASAIREALPATRPYVDRLIRIFRDRPDDDTSAVVLQDYARSALAGSAE